MLVITYVDIVLLILLLYALLKLAQVLSWANRLRVWIFNKHGMPQPMNGDPPKPPGWP